MRLQVVVGCPRGWLDMAALAVSGKLHLINGDKFKAAIDPLIAQKIRLCASVIALQRHRFNGGADIACRWRQNALLTGNKANL